MLPEEIQEQKQETSIRDDLEAAVAEVEALEAADTDAPEPVLEPDAKITGDVPKTVDDRPRDETGKFVKKEDAPATQAKADPQPQPDQAQTAEPVNAEPTAESMAGQTPPPGYSVAAKQAWASTPPAIREAIAKRETEINNGFAKLKDYQGLDRHIEMARSHGRELGDVVDAYQAAERKLEQDFVGGIKWLAQSYGVDLGQLAGALGGQQQQYTNGNNAPQVDLSPVTSELNQVKQEIQTFKQQQEQQVVESAQAEIQQFANNPENVYFENVREDMGKLIQNGMANDLADAYQKACALNPEIRQELINKQGATEAAKRQQEQQAAVQKAQKAARGVGSDIQAGSTVPPVSNGTLRDDLLAAWDDAEGRV